VSQQLRRFLHLERARTARPDGDGDVAARASTAERFDAVQRPAGPGPRAAARSGAELDRFGPEPEPVVELLDTDGRRPFNRCLRCGMDSNAMATTCPGCSASLDTPEARAFNERLWARHEAERAQEDADAATRQAARAADDVEVARLRRAMGEELAREVGASERRRLDAELGRGGWGWGWGRPRRARSLVELLLELLFGRWWRW
jgi:hypothetical protein